MQIHSLMRRCRVGLLAGLALILLLGLALPGYAQDDDIVSQVNDDTITRDAFTARVRFVRWQYTQELEKLYDLTAGHLALSRDYVTSVVDNLTHPDALGNAVLDQMEEERLMWQTGQTLDLLPTDDEIAAREAAFFSLWTDVPADEIATNADAQAFIENWYANATAASGLDHDALHEIFATEALREKLYNYVGENIPTEEMTVDTRHILCAFHPDNPSNTAPPTDDERAAAEACIAQAQARLQAGDDFATVARDLSDDASSAANGGDVGWVAVSYLSENYAKAAEDADLNTVVGPVETEYGLHLLEVLDRKMQPLTEDELAANQQGYFDLWIQALRNEATITRSDGWDTDIPSEPGLDSLDPAVKDAVDALQSTPVPATPSPTAPETGP